MYASFFGLNEKPFSITPDPRYLYLGPRHAEALAHLLYGITESGGFIQLTGEVGTGKTTVVRSLLEQLPENTDVALVLNPRLSPHEFLLTICDELDVEVPQRASMKSIVDALNERLLKAHAAGRRVVLIVDEAQNLSTEVLEQIRLLTNLETAKQKLLQIILIGQPELREVLARSDLRQLAQRITGRYHLEPLASQEVQAYVRHRLEVAGGRGQLFSAGALKVLHQRSDGIPRLVNVIADRALLGAWSREEPTVSANMTRKAAGEVFGQAGRRRKPRSRKTAVALLALAGVAIALLAVGGTRFFMQRAEQLPAPATAETGGRDAARTGIAAMPGMPATPVIRPQPGAAEAGDLPAAAAEESAETAAVTAAPPPLEAGGASVEPPSAAIEPLERQLASGRLATGTDAAFGALFDRWGLEYRPAAGPACEQAADAGLSCLLQRGTWGELRVLDRPVILVLTDAAGLDHQLVLQGTSERGVLLSAGDMQLELPLSEVLGLWYGEYLLLWRPEAGDGRVLARNSSGADVLWLRRALGSLRGAPVLPADSPNYGPAMEAAVRDFQRASRIAVDGIAGALTLISLHNALDLAGRPTLATEQ